MNVKHVIEIIKSIDKDRLGFDKDGRVLIKLNSLSDSSKEYLPPQQNHNDRRSLVYPMLFHPEDRVPRRNLLVWADELIQEYPAIFKPKLNAAKLAKVYNQAALIFSLMGEQANAISLCEKQVELLYLLSKTNNNILKYIIQPWINYGRLQRLNGDFDAALKTFALLNRLCEVDNHIEIFNYQFESSLVRKAISSDQEFTSLLTTCSLLEPVKTYLLARRYPELIDYLDIQNIPQGSALKPIADEAAIISYTYENKLSRSIAITNQAVINAPVSLLPVFLLREAEIRAICHSPNEKKYFKKISEYILYCSTNKIDIESAVFSLKAGKQFLKFGFEALAEQALEQALLLFEALGDEIGELEALHVLVKQNPTVAMRSRWENKLSQSSYASHMKFHLANKEIINQLAIIVKQLFEMLMSANIQKGVLC